MTNREIWNSDTDTNLSGSTTASILITKDIVNIFIIVFRFTQQM